MRLYSVLCVTALARACLALSDEPHEQIALGQPFHESEDVNVDPLTEAFNAKVAHVLKHYHVPGLAVSVVRNGTTYAKGYGLANTTTSTPVTPDTLFFAGSTTKAHTATAVSLLVANNTHYPHIQWNTPLHTLLPEFILSDPYATTHLTLTDILSHRSGLPRHDMVLFGQDLTLPAVVEKLKYLPMTEEIRTEFQYCNLMYVVAAHLIEKTTNQSLYEFLKENLWSPLNMRSTYLDTAPALADKREISEGYFFNPSTNKTLATNLEYSPVIRGAGNILTSVNDYAKWVSALLARAPPISEEGYAALFGAHSIVAPVVKPPFSAPDLYGFGWALQNYKGLQIIQHGGAQVGFGAFVVLLPEKETGFAILGNDMMGMNQVSLILAFEIIDGLLGIKQEERPDWEKIIDTLFAGLKFSNETLAALYPDLPDKDSLLPHPLALDAYSGRYTHPAYPTLKITARCPERDVLKNPEKWTGARLCASFENSTSGSMSVDLALDLFHVTGTFWTLVSSTAGMDAGARVEFRISAEGKVTEVGVEFDDMMQKKEQKIWLARA
ncbi:beta-lactamase/transpeptidase-like protein [Aspergillus cavernicola]|uniref:Beta-lactamase/transpeptidase-like protein n=1 Tax=Aspergillus cavernicola TaxID=176166 RepID=A0ABR4HTD1_9EURO